MTYRVITPKRLIKWLDELPDRDFERLDEKVKALAENPRPHGAKKLSDRESYRVRVGDYRIIYDIDDDAKLVTLRDISHRKDAYR